MQPHIQAALDRYAQHGIPTGGFLQAVLANDLTEAVSRADDDNLVDLRDICRYVYNELPSACWKSRQHIANWIEKHRLARERAAPSDPQEQVDRVLDTLGPLDGVPLPASQPTA